MKTNKNVMILNGKDIGISKIELNEADLLVTDRSGNYCLQVCVGYNWKDINTLEIGQKKEIDFNEYCFAEKNEPSLILPTNCFVKKVTEDLLFFHMNFGNLGKEVHFMNRKNRFDIELKSLEVEVYINYKDAKGDSILYNF